MPIFSNTRPSQLYGFILVCVAFLQACTNPNTNGTNTTGTGNNNGNTTTGNVMTGLSPWNGVDLSYSRTLSNGIIISSLAVSGGNIGRILLPDAEGIDGSVHFHRMTQSPSAYNNTQENNELGITAFVAERLKTTIPKIEINVAERTFPVTPHFFQGPNANDITGINGEFSSLFPGARLPQGRLTANVYMDAVRLADNIVDIPAAITVTTPSDAATIQSSTTLTIELSQPLNFVAGSAHCEITLFSTFGLGSGLAFDLPPALRTMAGGRVALTPPGNVGGLISVGAGNGGRVLNKILLPGTQRISFSPDELKILPDGRCLVCIVITDAKRIVAQRFILASTVINEFTINLR